MRRQQEWVTLQHGWGLDDVEILPGDEVRYRFPHVGPAVLQARYRAEGRLAEAEGAHDGLRPRQRRHDLPGDPGQRVSCSRATASSASQTPRGTIACRDVVLAAGPFSGVVAQLAGLDLEMRPRRRMKLVIPDLPDIPEDAPMTIDEETVAHWRPGMRGAYALFTDPTAPIAEPTDNVAPDAGLRLRPAQPDGAACPGPDQPVLEDGLGARRAGLGAPGRPVRVHARPPPVPRADARCRDWC